MRVVLTGAGGQLGRAFVDLLSGQKDIELIALTRKEIDFTHPKDLSQKISPLLMGKSKTVLLNAAAYTAVEKAEDEEAVAAAVNSESVGALAKLCFENEIPLVHFSTDYVFPGTGSKPYKEDDPTGPLNAYGRTKLEGERKILESKVKALIFRTSWVYSHIGQNFLLTILRLAKEKDSLSIVSDQFGAPTYAPHLAQLSWNALKQAIEKPKFPTGIYHLTGNGTTSWYDFARAIFERAETHGEKLSIQKVSPVHAENFPTKAIRPKNSRLNLQKIRDVFSIEPLHWEKSLDECMEKLYGKKNES